MVFPVLLIEWINGLPHEKRGRITSALNADPIIWRAVIRKPELAIQSLQKTPVRFPADFAYHYIYGDKSNLEFYKYFSKITQETESRINYKFDTSTTNQYLPDSDLETAFHIALKIKDGSGEFSDIAQFDNDSLDITDPIHKCAISILARLFENDYDFTQFFIEKFSPQVAMPFFTVIAMRDPRDDRDKLHYFEKLCENIKDYEFLQEICIGLEKTKQSSLSKRLSELILQKRDNFLDEINTIRETTELQVLSNLTAVLSKAKFFAELVGQENTSQIFSENIQYATNKYNNLLEYKTSYKKNKDSNLKFKIPKNFENFQFLEYVNNLRIKQIAEIIDTDKISAQEILKNAFIEIKKEQKDFNTEELLGITEVFVYAELFQCAEEICISSIHSNPNQDAIRLAYADICTRYGDDESAIEQFTLLSMQSDLDSEDLEKYLQLLLLKQEWTLMKSVLKRKLERLQDLADGQYFLLEYANLRETSLSQIQNTKRDPKISDHKKIVLSIIESIKQIDDPENCVLLQNLCRDKSVPIEIRYVIVSELLELGKYSEANACIPEVVNVTEANFLYARALIEAEQDNMARVVQSIQAGTKLGANVDQNLLKVLHLITTRKEPELFKVLIKDLSNRYPLNPVIRGYLGKHALSDKQTRVMGVEILEKLLKRTSVETDWIVWYLIGILNSDPEKFPLGVKAIDENTKKKLIHQLEPNFIFADNMLANIVLAELEDDREDAYRKLIKKFDMSKGAESWRIQAGMAQILTGQKQYSKAYPFIKNAIRLNPQNSILSSMFFDLLEKLKLNDDAYLFAQDQYLLTASNDNSGHAAIHFGKKISQIEGKTHEGFKWLSEIFLEISDLKKASPALAYLAACSGQLAKWNELDAQAEINLELDGVACLVYAQAAIKAGEDEKAFRWAEKSLRNCQDLQQIQSIELAAVFHKLGLDEKTKAAFINSNLGMDLYVLLLSTSLDNGSGGIADYQKFNEVFDEWEIRFADVPENWKTILLNPNIFMEFHQIMQALRGNKPDIALEQIKKLQDQNPFEFIYKFVQLLIEKMCGENINERNYANVLQSIQKDKINEEVKSFALSIIVHHELDLGHDVMSAELMDEKNRQRLKNCTLMKTANLRLANRMEKETKEQFEEFNQNQLVDEVVQISECEPAFNLVRIIDEYFRFTYLYNLITRLEIDNLSIKPIEIITYLYKSNAIFAFHTMLPELLRILEVEENLSKLLLDKALPKIDKEMIARLLELIQDTFESNIFGSGIQKFIWKIWAIIDPNIENLQKVVNFANENDDFVSKIRAMCLLGMYSNAYEIVDQRKYEQLLTYALNLDESRIQEKLQISTQLIQMDPQNPLGYALLAFIYEQIGSMPQALESMEIAISIWPEEVRWLAWTSRLAAQTGNHQKALEYCTESLSCGKIYPEDWDWIYKAIQSKNNDNYLFEIMNKLKFCKTNNYEFLIKSAENYIKQENYREALREINSAKGLRPGQQEAFLLQADIAIKIANYEKAYQIINNVLTKKEDCTPALLLLADLHNHQSGVDQAVKFLDDMISKGNDIEHFIVKKATILEHAGRIREAINTLEKFNNQSPHIAKVLVALSQLLFNNNEIDRSERVAQEAYKLTPRCYELLNVLGRINKQQGDLDQSVRFLTEAIKVNPLGFDSQMMLATVFFERKDFERAKNTIKNAIKLLPKEVKLYNLLADILIQEGNIEEAKNVLVSAVNTVKPSDDLQRKLESLTS